ncbi:MAG: metallophosphoesterase [Clostridia bacterium]|nr:metallophosphoesterase [Clostridia bacterium]
MTDIHLFSKRNWLADPYKWERKSSQLQMRESEDIIREAFDIILKDPDTNTVLITGDLTDNGEFNSQEDLLKILEEYTAKGLRILLTTSTHDFAELNKTKFSKPDENKGLSYGYDENYEYKRFIPCAKREDLRVWYAPYSLDNAISVHHESMSYACDLDEKHRLIAINDDYIANDKNNQRGLYKEQLDWILCEAKKAKEEGKTIVCFTHHPILVPSPIYKLIGARDVLADNVNLANLLADSGINFIFTGHSHIHDIEYHKSENGNLIYDISTGALVGSPPLMRKVNFLEDGSLDIKTIKLESLSGFDLNGKTLSEYCRESFFGMIEDMLKEMSGDMVNFAIYANSISIRPWTVYQYWWIFKTAGIFLNKLTVGTVYKWCKKESRLTPEEIKPIKNEKVVPIILKLVEKLYAGNADISPNNPEFSVIMGTVAILDDIVKTLGLNLKNIIGFSSVKEIVEPLVFNNGIDDYNAILSPHTAPTNKEELPAFTSNKGVGIIISLILGVLISLPILLPSGIILALLIFLRGKFNPYKDYKKVLPPRVQK